MTDIKTMSPATGEVITKTGEVVNLVDVLGGATPVDETVYDIESYSPRTGLIIGSDGKAYDLVDLLQGGSGPSGDCVTKEELEEKFAEKLQPIQDSVSTSEGKVSAMEGKVATCESKVTAIEKKVDGMDAVSIDMVEDLQEQLDKSEAKVDALWKLNQGQTYDFKEEVETGISDAPAGAHYMSLEEVQGDTRQDNYHMGLAVDAGTVEGCAEAPIRELQMFGRTEQETTNGYQKLRTINKTWQVNGNVEAATYEILNDYGISVTISDASSAFRGVYASIPNDFEDGVDITISADVTISAGSTLTMYALTSSKSFTLQPGVKTRISATGVKTHENMCIYGGTDLTPKTIIVENLMIEADSVAHDFEPYTGGIASPNPEYPQKFQAVEEINVKVIGKNLFDVDKSHVGLFWPWPGDTYTWASYSNEAITASDRIPVKAGWVITVTTYISTAAVALIKPLRKDNIPVQGVRAGNVIATDGSKQTYTWTVPEGVDYIGINVDTANKDKVQVEISTTATEYEPYREQTVSVTPPRPLNKVGELADICDVEKGVWEYMNDTYVAKFAEEQNIMALSKEIRAVLPPTWEYQNTNIICSHGYAYEPTWSRDKVGIFAGAGSGRFIALRCPVNITRSEFDALNVTYVFNSTDPVTEPIDPSDLATIRALSTYAGYSTIFVTDQLGRDVSTHFRFRRVDDYREDDVVAPTPLYPSEIHSVERINVKVTGKNLLGKWYDGQISQDDGLTITANGFKHSDYFGIDGRGFSLYAPTYIRYFFYDADKRFISTNSVNPPDGVYISNVPANARYVRVHIDSINNRQLMLALGNSIEYEQYSEQITTIIPPKPMNRLGEYIDQCDIESGNWVYKTERLVLDGKMPWSKVSNGGYYTPITTRYKLLTPCMCSIAVHGARDEIKGFESPRPLYDTSSVKGTGITIYDGRGRYTSDFFYSDEILNFSGVEEFIEWIDAKKPVVIKVLNEAETFDVKPDDLAFLRSLELLPADHHITITDQDGNDVSYLMEYIIKLSEVVS